MKIWHVLTIFVLFCLCLYLKPKKHPEIVSNYYIIGPERVLIHYDSIRSMEFFTDDSVVVMIRFDDTIRIHSVKYTMKLNTYKID